MIEIVCCIVVSTITSVLITKKLATHYFEIVDSYIKDISDMTKQFVESMKHKDS